MTAPAVDAQRFGAALLLGLALGVYYGFLRPLRPKYTALSDLLFAPGAVWAWVYLGFGVCRGDVRLSYSLGLLAGACLWEATFGRWLRPVFWGFWHILGGIFGKITAPVKNFLKKVKKFAKNIFSIRKKWFTITKYHPHSGSKDNGGAPYGRKREYL